MSCREQQSTAPQVSAASSCDSEWSPSGVISDTSPTKFRRDNQKGDSQDAITNLTAYSGWTYETKNFRSAGLLIRGGDSTNRLTTEFGPALVKDFFADNTNKASIIGTYTPANLHSFIHDTILSPGAQTQAVRDVVTSRCHLYLCRVV